MPRKKETAKKSQSVLSANLRAYLLTGGRAKGDYAVFLLSGDPKRLKAIWLAVRAKLLPDWIKKNPCTRPYGFWKFEALEPRQQVAGKGDGFQPGYCMDFDGLPKYWQLCWDKDDPPKFESESAYLKRHGLLTSAEKKYLNAHSELLEPEQISIKNE